MSISELKLEIINSICSIQDVNVLEKIKQLIIEKDNYILSQESVLSVNEVAEKYKNENLSSKEDVHIFTPEQRKRILNSLQQCEKGNTLTKEEAEADIEQWL